MTKAKELLGQFLNRVVANRVAGTGIPASASRRISPTVAWRGRHKPCREPLESTSRSGAKMRDGRAAACCAYRMRADRVGGDEPLSMSGARSCDCAD